jgi:hypothetical protein
LHPLKSSAFHGALFRQLAQSCLETRRRVKTFALQLSRN